MNDPSLAAIEHKRNYITLDGIRGVAALAVVSRHFAVETAPISLPGSYLAVDIFFAMSGFVLAYSYDDRLGIDLTAAQFMQKRLIRLYPLFLLSIVIVASGVAFALAARVPMTWRGASLATSIVLSLLFLPTPQSLTGISPLFPMNGPAWSLFMEVAVNVVYAAIRPVLTLRALHIVLIATGVALGAAIIAHGSADIGGEWATLAIAPPRVLFSFFLGVALYRWDRAGRLPHVPLPAWSVLLLMLMIFAGAFSGFARIIVDLAAIVLLLPLLLIAGIQNQPAHFGRLFTFLGVTSYPIYVLHVPLQKYLAAGAGRFGHLADYAPFAGLAIVAAMLPIGWLAHRCYDVPVRRGLSRWVRGERGPVARAHEA